MKKIILITGGQRSGKSRYAEQLALSLSLSLYTHLRAHETPEQLVCRLLLEKKNNNIRK